MDLLNLMEKNQSKNDDLIDDKNNKEKRTDDFGLMQQENVDNIFESTREHEQQEEHEQEYEYKQQDADYHEYTGRGPVARHHSEVLAKRKTSFSNNSKEKAFQERIIAELKVKADKNIADVNEKLKIQNNIKQGLRKFKNSETGEDEDNEEYIKYKEWKILDKQLEEIRANYTHQKNVRSYYLGIQKQYKVELEEKDKYLKELIKKKQEFEKDRIKLESKIQELANNNKEIQNNIKENKTVFFAEYRLKRNQQSMADNNRLLMDRNIEIAKKQNEIEAAEQQKQELDTQYIKIKDIIKNYKIDDVDIEAKKKEVEEKKALIDKNYLKIYNDNKDERKKLKQDEADFEKKKRDIEDDVLNAEIIDMPMLKDGRSSMGMVIDGGFYLDKTDFSESEAEEIKNGKDSEYYDRQEAAILLNEQIIVQGLKKKEIFNYINSDNLMEYATYDENKADFDIPEEVKTDTAKSELKEKIQTITDNLKVMGVDSKLPEVFEPFIKGENINLEQLSAGMLQEAMSIQAMAEIMPESTREDHYRPMMVFIGIADGIWNVAKALGVMALDGGLAYAGIDKLIDTRAGNRTGDLTYSDSFAGSMYKGVLTAVAPLSIGIDMLAKTALANADLISKTSSAWGEWSLMGLDVLGESSMSVVGAAAAGVNIGVNMGAAILAHEDKNDMREVAERKRSMNQSRYGRMLEEAAVVNAIKEWEGYVGMATGALSVAFALTGLGGLAATGISVAAGVLVKKIGGAIRNSKQKNDVLNAPEVLGGIDYNDEVIDDKHFNKLLANVTGINDKDSLYNAIKIADSVDLHRGMRASISRPDAGVDEAMAGIGFSDRSKYAQIKLSDIHKKVGYSGDWKKDIRAAIEIKGLDYDTNWTTFVKGIAGKDHYKGDGFFGRERFTRKEMMAKRRKEISK